MGEKIFIPLQDDFLDFSSALLLPTPTAFACSVHLLMKLSKHQPDPPYVKLEFIVSFVEVDLFSVCTFIKL